MNVKGRDRFWLIGGAAAVLLVFVLGWFFFISPQNSNTDSLKSNTDTAKSQVAVLQQRLNQLKDQNKDLAKYQQQLATDQAALPAAPDLPNFVRNLQATGTAAGVNVSSVTVQAPTAVTGASAAATDTASPSAAPHASTGGVYSITIALTATGEPTALNTFIQQLQQVQSRAVLISSVSMTSGTAGSSLPTLSLTLQAFLAPSATASASASASATAPAGQ
ncbi:MAG: type II secretion system protein M [Actinobacteria bacterium]|nr:type II secretion system protein M [Actinomycetota bacterium]